MLDEALYYAEKLGWPVFPLSPGTKVPNEFSRGFHDATTETARIRTWWGGEPVCNVGIATGRLAGLVVIDLDGEQAKESVVKYGGGKLPQTPMVQTPKGWHVYLRHPDTPVRSRVRVLPGIDVRGEGGYVVAPPSVVSGRAYTWKDSATGTPLADIPEWLYRALLSTAGDIDTACLGWQAPQPIKKGERDFTIYRMARKLRWSGLTRNAFDVALRTVNTERCQPPLDDAAMSRLIEHAWTQPDR